MYIEREMCMYIYIYIYTLNPLARASGYLTILSPITRKTARHAMA